MNRLESLLNEYNSLGISEQIDYDKFYLYSIITHSTAIEGSTVTEIENRLLFDEGIGSSKPIAEQMMNLDLKKGYDRAFFIADKHEDITVETLCELSGIIMNNTGTIYKTMTGNFNSARGDLRKINVSAGRGGKSYMSWQKVPEKLEKFCSWLRNNWKLFDSYDRDTEAAYRISFEAHYHLVTIHPWADGNGRMARLVMNLIQHEAKVIPSIVKKESRLEYIRSLSYAQEKEDESIFLEFMMQHHCRNLEEIIREYKESIGE